MRTHGGRRAVRRPRRAARDAPCSWSVSVAVSTASSRARRSACAAVRTVDQTADGFEPGGASAASRKADSVRAERLKPRRGPKRRACAVARSRRGSDRQAGGLTERIRSVRARGRRAVRTARAALPAATSTVKSPLAAEALARSVSRTLRPSRARRDAERGAVHGEQQVGLARSAQRTKRRSGPAEAPPRARPPAARRAVPPCARRPRGERGERLDGRHRVEVARGRGSRPAVRRRAGVPRVVQRARLGQRGPTRRLWADAPRRTAGVRRAGAARAQLGRGDVAQRVGSGQRGRHSNSRCEVAMVRSITSDVPEARVSVGA